MKQQQQAALFADGKRSKSYDPLLWPTGKVPEIPDHIPSSYNGLYKTRSKIGEKVNFNAMNFLLQERNKEDAAQALIDLQTRTALFEDIIIKRIKTI